MSTRKSPVKQVKTGGRGPRGRFRKGQSGNPKGRPRSGRAFSEALRANLTLADLKAIAVKLTTMAKEGDIRAITEIRDTLEGKPTQRHEIDYVRREAERLAEKYGLDADVIVREAEAILKESQ